MSSNNQKKNSNCLNVISTNQLKACLHSGSTKSISSCKWWFSLSDQMATMTRSTVHSRKIPKIANFLTWSSVPPSVCLYINPPSLLSLESHQHDSGRQFPVCWGRRRRRYFLRPAACWTKCSASAQSQEPRGQRRRPSHSETWHTITGLGIHALILKKKKSKIFSSHHP